MARIDLIPKVQLVQINRTNPKGEQCIYIRIPYKGRYLKRSTDIWIFPNEWDARCQEIKGTNKNADRLNNKLKLMVEAVKEKLLKVEGPIVAETITTILGTSKANSRKVDSVNPDFISYALHVNDILYGAQKYGYTSWYSKKKNIEAFETYLVHYARIPKPKINQVTLSMFDSYIQYRFKVRKNTSNEGVNKTLVPLYTALEYAEKNNLVSKRIIAPIVSNYLAVRETVYKSKEIAESQIKYLTPAQIKNLFEYCRNLKSQTARDTMDMFFFSFFACGLRLSDIITLEWSHIDMDRHTLRKVQVKTKKPLEVDLPLNKNAMEILYRWQRYGRNSRYVFNRIPEKADIDDQEFIFMKRNCQDKLLNRVLRIVGINAKLPIHLTMHVARHSFAVMSINSGMSVFMLSKLLGHSSTSATEKTYAKFLKKKVDDEVSLLYDFEL